MRHGSHMYRNHVCCATLRACILRFADLKKSYVGLLQKFEDIFYSDSAKLIQFGENQLKTICETLNRSSNLKYLELKDLDPESDLVSMNLLDAVLTNLRGFS